MKKNKCFISFCKKFATSSSGTLCFCSHHEGDFMNFLINYEKTNNKQFSKSEVFDKLKTLYFEKTTNYMKTDFAIEQNYRIKIMWQDILKPNEIKKIISFFSKLNLIFDYFWKDVVYKVYLLSNKHRINCNKCKMKNAGLSYYHLWNEIIFELKDVLKEKNITFEELEKNIEKLINCFIIEIILKESDINLFVNYCLKCFKNEIPKLKLIKH